MTPELLLRLGVATAWQIEYRKRLASISWFMRSLKQRISQRANEESGCSGHFWDARFISVPLPDLKAVVGCMAYVDANPFRAKVVGQPEQAAHTSLRARLHPESLAGQAEAVLAAHLTPLMLVAPVDGLSGQLGACALTLADYVDVVHAGCGLAQDPGRAAAFLGWEVEAWRKQFGTAGMYQAAARS
jgi:hypothetical protein